MDIIIQILGWAGTMLIVSAYFLLSRKIVDGQNRVYQFMNFFGAIGVGVNVFHQEAWPALALQVIWGTIAIITLIKIRTNR